MVIIQAHAIHATAWEVGKCSLTECQGRWTKYALTPNRQSMPLLIRQGNLSQQRCLYLWPASENLIIGGGLCSEKLSSFLYCDFMFLKYYSGRTLRKHILRTLFIIKIVLPLSAMKLKKIMLASNSDFHKI